MPNNNFDLELQEFSIGPDDPFIISVGDVVFQPPFFVWNDAGQDWLDATGFYDLCLSADNKRMYFTSRKAGVNRFAYRYYSLNWLVNRLGIRNNG